MRKSFKEEKVDVVLTADETSIRFHEYTTTFLVSIGVKRVGATLGAEFSRNLVYW